MTDALSHADDTEPHIIPHQNDEVALVRIKADPKKYVGKSFVICGGLQISDYYNYSYGRSEKTHHSLKFVELGKTTREIGIETCHGYLLKRNASAAIIDTIAKGAEENKTREFYKVARVKVMLIQVRYENDKQWDMLEVLDAQFMDKDFKEWQPWIVETEEAAKRAEAKADREADEADRAAKLKDDLAGVKAAETARWREWTDAKGGKFKARFSGIVGGDVQLKKDGGEVVKMRLDKMSKEEREWIEKKKWQLQDSSSEKAPKKSKK